MAGIGFFAPLPLAMMLPFMAGQSMIMGDAFGKAYQYGKRKISAMTNEEFNKLTFADLSHEIVTDYSSLIPNLQKSISLSRDFQSFIIQELSTIITSLPKNVLQAVGNESETITKTLTGQYGIAPEFAENNVNSLTNFFNALSKTINNITTIPQAYGEHPPIVDNTINADTFTNIQTGTQIVQGETEGPQQGYPNSQYATMTRTQLLNAQNYTKSAQAQKEWNYYYNLGLQQMKDSNKTTTTTTLNTQQNDYVAYVTRANTLLNALATTIRNFSLATTKVKQSPGSASALAYLRIIKSHKGQAIDNYRNYLTQQRNSKNTLIIKDVAMRLKSIPT